MVNFYPRRYKSLPEVDDYSSDYTVKNRACLHNFRSDLGHSYDLGVGHSYDLPPPYKVLKWLMEIFALSYDL